MSTTVVLVAYATLALLPAMLGATFNFKVRTLPPLSAQLVAHWVATPDVID